MKTTELISCSACETGHYEEIFTRYEAMAADDIPIVIPNAKLLRCSNCGDELIPPETQGEIDRAVAEQTDQLNEHELEAMAERFGHDQTKIAEILGLGSKTFHRWLRGHQYPSRSMGYYLRVLAEFPEAFEWLKERRWRNINRVAHGQENNLAILLPDLDRTTGQAPLVARAGMPPIFPELHGRRVNPPLRFGGTVVK